MNEWMKAHSIIIHERGPQLDPSIAGFFKDTIVVSWIISFGQKYLVNKYHWAVLGRIHLPH